MSLTDDTTVTRTDVLATIREALVVAAPEVDPGADPAAHLREDLEVDSLALLELVARLEHHYGVQVPDDLWPTLTSMDAIADFLLAGGSR